MSLVNTATRYGHVSKTFHWLTALLIISLIPLGLIANDLPYETSEQLATKAFLFSIHKTLGLFVFFVALARIAWTLMHPKPEPLHPDRKLEHFAAETVHWLLYGSLVLVPLSGWIHHAATTGFAPIWWPFGQNLPFVPKDEGIAGFFAALHLIFEKVLTVAVLLHVAGALKHHVIDKDATLRRMWFGSTESEPNGSGHSNVLPGAAAIGAWAAAMVIGAYVGVFEKHHATPIQSVALEVVQSDWAVQDGSLGISVTQLGSVVEGEFAEWTAAIQFDETVESGVAGNVEVQIAIPSLTLGSVTGQAMGADYFDAENFAVATFAADLVAIPDGYTATGTLTIKGTTLPVDMPFTLLLDGDTAEVAAALTLDRRDFAIGNSMTDEASLKFAVDVAIALTASRSAE